MQINKIGISHMAGYSRAYLRRNAAYLLSFFIPLSVMLGIFIYNGVFPFDDWSFMHSDMYHQYVPFLSEMLHKLRSNDSLFYSWNVGIGSNFIALYAYYMASPFNWFMLLFPDAYLIEFMSYLVILKIGLCGFTFSWYLSRHFHSKSLALVPFSVFYALSGYLAAYNWNVMWLDCIFLFPLIALGLERLVSEGRYRLYCISLALCILSNYYISIMICIFLVLYFVLLLFTYRKTPGQVPRIFLRFALFSGLAGGMAAILLIPELAALRLTKFTQFRFPEELKFYFTTIDMLSRHCINVAVETGLDHWPNLYCGVAVFLLVPLYMANRKIPLREKAARFGLLALLLVSFAANIPNFIWHGMNYPDSLPCRQSFLYIFLLLTLCCEALLRIRACSFRTVGSAFCLSLGAVLLFEKLMEGQEAYSVESFLLTAVFLCLYGAFLYLYRKGNFVPETSFSQETASQQAQGTRSRAFLLSALLLLVTAEVTVNMYQTSCSVTSRSNYLKDNDSYAALAERIREEDPDFFRFEKKERRTKNDGTLIGYPTASLFSSTANGHVEELYETLGMSHSKVFYCFDGATPLTSSLLSVRYLFSRSANEDTRLYELTGQDGEIYLYRCKYSLPLGFWMEADPILGNALEHGMEQEAANPLDRQNRMAAALGMEGNLFISAAAGSDAASTIVSVEEPGHYYAWVGNNRVDTLKMESGGESQTFEKLKHHYICDLGWHDFGEMISLHSEDSNNLELSVYRLDYEVLDAMISALGSVPMTVDSFDSTRIVGHIRTERTGELILSMPYEPGWAILVDGEKITPSLFADTFPRIPLEPGEHIIRMHYRPAGFTAGILVSACSLFLFLCFVFHASLRKRPGSDTKGGLL